MFKLIQFVKCVLQFDIKQAFWENILENLMISLHIYSNIALI